MTVSYLLKYKISLYPVIFLIILLNNQLYGQKKDWLSFVIQANMIPLSFEFPDGSTNYGFAFIIAEIDDTLVFATAKHNVYNSEKKLYASKINAGSFDCIPVITEMDIAFVRLKKVNKTEWLNYHLIDRKYGVNDKVWILGSDRKLISTPRWYNGIITEINKAVISADFSGARKGTSGGALISKRGIVGLITDDDLNKISVIRIDTIMQIARYGFGIKNTNTKGLHIGVGLSIGVSSPLIFSEYMEDYKPSFNPALILEPVLNSKFALRLKAQTMIIKSYEIQVDNLATSFKNRMFIIDMSMVYHFRPDLYLKNTPDFVETTPFGSYFYLGLSGARTNPLYKTNLATWQPLTDFANAKYNYTKLIYGLNLGAGAGVLVNNLRIDFEAGVILSTSRFLGRDVLDYNISKIDACVQASINISYMLRPGKQNGLFLN